MLCVLCRCARRETPGDDFIGKTILLEEVQVLPPGGGANDDPPGPQTPPGVLKDLFFPWGWKRPVRLLLIPLSKTGYGLS